MSIPDPIEILRLRIALVAHNPEFRISESILCEVDRITDNIPAFLAQYQEDGPDMDFVYDLKTGFVFINLYAHHQVLMSRLYESHTGDHSLSTSQAADKYVMCGFGIFRSSVSRLVYYSKQAVIPANVKYVLRRDLEIL